MRAAAQSKNKKSAYLCARSAAPQMCFNIGQVFADRRHCGEVKLNHEGAVLRGLQHQARSAVCARYTA